MYVGIKDLIIDNTIIEGSTDGKQLRVYYYPSLMLYNLQADAIM